MAKSPASEKWNTEWNNDREIRDKKRWDELGVDGACHCGEDEPHSLVCVEGVLICRNCKAKKQKSFTDLTIPTCGNCHAWLTDAQQDWPKGASANELYLLACLYGLALSLRNEERLRNRSQGGIGRSICAKINM